MDVPTAGPRPIAFAHRGARLERWENTLAAFAHALRLGATGLETDAWLTADGVVVLHHDARIGLPGRRRPIAVSTRAELPRHVPTLGDLLRVAAGGPQLSIDLKAPATLQRIVAEADDAGATGRLWLCHPDWHFLAWWRPRVAGARLVNSTRRGWVVEGLDRRVAGLERAGIDALNLPAEEWTSPLVGAVHAAGMQAFGWGAQRARDIDRLLDLGVDGIYSDHVRRLVRRVERESRAAPRARGPRPQNQARRLRGQMRAKARPTIRRRGMGPK